MEKALGYAAPLIDLLPGGDYRVRLIKPWKTSSASNAERSLTRLRNRHLLASSARTNGSSFVMPVRTGPRLIGSRVIIITELKMRRPASSASAPNRNLPSVNARCSCNRPAEICSGTVFHCWTTKPRPKSTHAAASALLPFRIRIFTPR